MTLEWIGLRRDELLTQMQRRGYSWETLGERPEVRIDKRDLYRWWQGEIGIESAAASRVWTFLKLDTSAAMENRARARVSQSTPFVVRQQPAVPFVPHGSVLLSPAQTKAIYDRCAEMKTCVRKVANKISMKQTLLADRVNGIKPIPVVFLNRLLNALWMGDVEITK